MPRVRPSPPAVLLRCLPLWLGACASPAVLIDDGSRDPGEGWADQVPVGADPDDPAPIDPARWAGASFEIVAPEAGAVLPLDQPVSFQAALRGADGAPVPADRITWTSAAVPGWGGLGLDFTDGTLPAGTHGITATAELPTGDVLAHTVPVRVQHPAAGVWTGLFQATGDLGELQFTCAGSATLAIDALGEIAEGTGACVAGLGVGTLPLDMVFDLHVDPDGALVGDAGTVLVGGLVYDFPASGTVEPDGLSLSWSGQVPLLNFAVQGQLDAAQVALDPL